MHAARRFVRRWWRRDTRSVAFAPDAEALGAGGAREIIPVSFVHRGVRMVGRSARRGGPAEDQEDEHAPVPSGTFLHGDGDESDHTLDERTATFRADASTDDDATSVPSGSFSSASSVSSDGSLGVAFAAAAQDADSNLDSNSNNNESGGDGGSGPRVPGTVQSSDAIDADPAVVLFESLVRARYDGNVHPLFDERDIATASMLFVDAAHRIASILARTGFTVGTGEHIPPTDQDNIAVVQGVAGRIRTRIDPAAREDGESILSERSAALVRGCLDDVLDPAATGSNATRAVLAQFVRSLA
jgi:hypothetical protein